MILLLGPDEVEFKLTEAQVGRWIRKERQGVPLISIRLGRSCLIARTT